MYMDMAAILVKWPENFIPFFRPFSKEAPNNMALIVQAVCLEIMVVYIYIT